MWPWEHLAVGYLFYSAYARVVHSERPGNADTAVLVLGTQIPDLIDKPLAWWLGVLPSGLSLGHSLLFGVPVCLFVVGLARLVDKAALGRAYSIGYLSHLFSDVLYNAVTSGRVYTDFLFWPIVPSPPVTTPGFLTQVRRFVAKFVEFLSTPTGRVYLLFELALLITVLAVWVADRYPGWGLVRQSARRVTGLGRR